MALHVEQLGEGDPSLVLVHGFTGSTMDWQGVGTALAADRRVVAFDHRGHDQSGHGPAEDYTFDQLRADVELVVDTLGLDRFDLLGHSMGGMIAQRYVLAHPDRVRSLVLMDTAAAPSRTIPRAFMEAPINVARAQGMAAVAELMKPLVANDPLADDKEERIRRMDPEAFARLGMELLESKPLTDRLPEITCPTTVIVGANDAGLRPAADELAAGIPGAVLEVVADAAHCPQEDQPDAWLAVMRAHLARAAR